MSSGHLAHGGQPRPVRDPHDRVIAGLAITPVPGSGEPERVTLPVRLPWAFHGYGPQSADVLYCAERAVVPVSPKPKFGLSCSRTVSRLIDPLRTSPTAKTPGRLVSRNSQHHEQV